MIFINQTSDSKLTKLMQFFYTSPPTCPPCHAPASLGVASGLTIGSIGGKRVNNITFRNIMMHRESRKIEVRAGSAPPTSRTDPRLLSPDLVKTLTKESTSSFVGLAIRESSQTSSTRTSGSRSRARGRSGLGLLSRTLRRAVGLVSWRGGEVGRGARKGNGDKKTEVVIDERRKT